MKFQYLILKTDEDENVQQSEPVGTETVIIAEEASADNIILQDASADTVIIQDASAIIQDTDTVIIQDASADTVIIQDARARILFINFNFTLSFQERTGGGGKGRRSYMPRIINNKNKIVANGKQLRRNQTPQEIILWSKLRATIK